MVLLTCTYIFLKYRRTSKRVVMTILFNTENTNCTGSDFCANFAEGDLNTQNLNCARSNTCLSIVEGDLNTQNTACQSSECFNFGINTNVIANSAISCNSGDPDTTTICQRDRTFTFPNY